MTREQTILRVSWAAVAGNAILALIKITMGYVSGSLALTGDGFDTATDVVTSAVTVYAAKFSGRQPDEKYPYGYGRADTVAAKTLSFVIFFAGAQLVLTAVNMLLSGEEAVIPANAAFVAVIISVAGKLMMAVMLYRAADRTKSRMLAANATNMKNDIFISLSVLAGLFFTHVLDLPQIDLGVSVFIGFLIIRGSLDIFRESALQLMDGVEDTEIYGRVFAAVGKVEGVCHPHKVRIRSLGDKYMISLDIEANPEITVRQAHDLSKQVEKTIKKDIEDVYDVVVHVEPLENMEEEKYGVCK